MTYASSILITGASSGLGEALALTYAQAGVFLLLTGRNADRLAQVAAACRAKGAAVETAALDVCDEEGMRALIEEWDQKHPFTLVFANAGISGGTGTVMGGEPMAQAREIFATNINGVLNTLAPLIPRMAERKNGQIALISSMAGFRGFPSAPAYSASKGAVRFYGEALRGVLAPLGVRVNVICPGFVKTRMTDANDFSMPFLMDADRATKIIQKGLKHNRGRIAFPWPMHLMSWFLSVLPDSLAQKILVRLPAKPVQKNHQT